jgi:hypothetical protein
MSTLAGITGIWHGSYWHDRREPFLMREPVPFTLTLDQGWFGRFKGTVADGGPQGMPGDGVVAGRFRFPRIEFTKRMPVCYVGTRDGRMISLREYLAEQGYRCDFEVPHSPIFYQGEFVNSTEVKGTWVIRPGRIWIGKGRSIGTQGGNGSWSMELKPT